MPKFARLRNISKYNAGKLRSAWKIKSILLFSIIKRLKNIYYLVLFTFLSEMLVKEQKLYVFLFFIVKFAHTWNLRPYGAQTLTYFIINSFIYWPNRPFFISFYYLPYVLWDPTDLIWSDYWSHSLHRWCPEIFRILLSCKVNARRSVHSPRYHLIITLIISRQTWLTPCEGPLTRNLDRSWWHRHTSLKLFWPQSMVSCTTWFHFFSFLDFFLSCILK